MSTRLKWPQLSPEGHKALLAFETYTHHTGLEKPLLDLIRLRVSQINNCAYCIDMHWKDLRAAGETEQRLSLVSVWREYLGFNDRERAAKTPRQTLVAGAPPTRPASGSVKVTDHGTLVALP